MLTNNTTITVFNAKKIGRETVWIKNTVQGVNYHGTDQVLVSDKGATSSEEYVIRFPNDVLKQYCYVDSNTFKSLSCDECIGLFTLKKGDYIVKGNIEDEVSSVSDILKLDAQIITKVTENMSASEFSKHIKVVVK